LWLDEHGSRRRAPGKQLKKIKKMGGIGQRFNVQS
jgi:hypothetical protein